MKDEHKQAGSVPYAWNIEEVGCSDPNDPIREYSKLAPWPYTDGDYLYSGGYVPRQCNRYAGQNHDIALEDKNSSVTVY